MPTKLKNKPDLGVNPAINEPLSKYYKETQIGLSVLREELHNILVSDCVSMLAKLDTKIAIYQKMLKLKG